MATDPHLELSNLTSPPAILPKICWAVPHARLWWGARTFQGGFIGGVFAFEEGEGKDATGAKIRRPGITRGHRTLLKKLFGSCISTSMQKTMSAPSCSPLLFLLSRIVSIPYCRARPRAKEGPWVVCGSHIRICVKCIRSASCKAIVVFSATGGAE